MTEQLIYLLREGLVLLALLSLPPLLASVAVSLGVSVVQALLRVEDDATRRVPRLYVVYGAIFLAGPWTAAQLLQFTRTVFDTIVTVGAG